MTHEATQTSTALTDGMRVIVRCGAGVMGKQPLIHPGEHFEYTSTCVLETPTGEMRGTYQMQRADGRIFDAVDAPFLLAPPHSLN